MPCPTSVHASFIEDYIGSTAPCRLDAMDCIIAFAFSIHVECCDNNLRIAIMMSGITLWSHAINTRVNRRSHQQPRTSTTQNLHVNNKWCLGYASLAVVSSIAWISNPRTITQSEEMIKKHICVSGSWINVVNISCTWGLLLCYSLCAWCAWY